MRAYIPVELSVDMTHMHTRVYITYYQYSIVLGAERNLFYGKISIFAWLKRSCPLHQAKNTYFCLIGAIIRGAHISIAAQFYSRILTSSATHPQLGSICILYIITPDKHQSSGSRL